MKRVLLDCDGVLADFIGAVLVVVEEVTGRRHVREDVDRFDFASCLGLTPTEKTAVFDAISRRDNWWAELAVLPGALEGVAALREVADVYVVTSPWWTCDTWMAQRLFWLHRHFGINVDHVVMTSAKHLVDGDVIVDDKTTTLREWFFADGRLRNGRAVQWITPHNRLDGWLGPATNSWEQLVRWCR